MSSSSDKKPGVLGRFLSQRGMGQVITVTGGLIVLCLVFGFINPNFFTYRNTANLLRQIAPTLLIGVGQSYVLFTGNIDLSIGSVVGMSCMISATLMCHGMNPWVAMVITLVVCLLVGYVNGILVSKCKLPPFIATLGTMTMARGIAQIVNGNYNTDSIGEAAKGFRTFFYSGKILGIFSAFWIALVIWFIFNYIMSCPRTGRHIYATGSNIDAARLSGVNVDNTVICVYIVSAFCACITGLITCASTGTGTMDAGTSYECSSSFCNRRRIYIRWFRYFTWYCDRFRYMGSFTEWSSICRSTGCYQEYRDRYYRSCCGTYGRNRKKRQRQE